MKTKLTFLVIITALVTLSFSFISNSSSKNDKAGIAAEKTVSAAPIGGFVSER